MCWCIDEKCKAAAGEVIQFEIQLMGWAKACPCAAVLIIEGRRVPHLLEVNFKMQHYMAGRPGNACFGDHVGSGWSVGSVGENSVFHYQVMLTALLSQADETVS